MNEFLSIPYLQENISIFQNNSNNENNQHLKDGKNSNSDITDDMTLEQVFQLWQHKSIKKIDDITDQHLLTLFNELEAAKQELWDAHNKAVQHTSSSTLTTNHSITNSNSIHAPQHTNASNNTNNTDNNETKNKTVKSIQISIQSGPHKDQFFALKPTTRSPCFVGRSTVKKFVQKGISLHLDNQVSTTHGKFTLVRGYAYFTDTGSTNGTLVKGESEELEVDERLELKEGMVLLVGNSELLIALGYD